MNISVMFKDDTQSLTINPIHVQHVEVLEPQGANQAEVKIYYGTQYVPNEIGTILLIFLYRLLIFVSSFH